MSTFQSTIEKIRIEPHPNADRLELAVVGGYRCIVGKDQYKTGDLVAYIPEQAIVPDDVIETLNLTGKLGGKQKNRVRAIKLRNVVSQGLIHPLNKGRLAEQSLAEGDDVTEILGLTKYEPEIPTNMSGEVEARSEWTVKYDIENIKKFPDLIEGTDKVVITEKLHGTFLCAAFHDGEWRASSKGLGAKGLVFKNNKINSESNLYVKMMNENLDALNKLAMMVQGDYVGENSAIYILGEIYGKGVQDLTYGITNKQFAIFDIMYRDSTGNSEFINWHDMEYYVKQSGLNTVPRLFIGQYDDVSGHPAGQSELDPNQIREGVVIKSVYGWKTREGERLIVKSVSDDYLFRKNGTEYN